MHVLFELHAAHRVAGLAVFLQQFRDESGIRAAALPQAAAVPVRERDVAAPHAVQEQFLRGGGDVAPLCFEERVFDQTEIELDRPSDSLQNVLAPLADRTELAEDRDRPLLDRQRVVGNQTLLHEVEPHAEPGAVGAHSLRTVEAEQLRRRRLVTDAAVRAGVVAGVELVGKGRGLRGKGRRRVVGKRGVRSAECGISSGFLRATLRLQLRTSHSDFRTGFLRPLPLSPRPLPLARHDQPPFGQVQRRFDRFADPRAGRLARHQPVDHDVDRVLHLLVEFQIVGQLHDFAVNPRTQKATLQQVGEQIPELTLLPLHNRSQDLKLGPVGQTQNAVEDVFARLRRDRPAALMATRLTDAGEQHAQIVVDLGDCPDR